MYSLRRTVDCTHGAEGMIDERQVAGGGRILVVEDDDSVRRYLCVLLQTAGYATIGGPTCASVRPVLEDPDADIVCVLLDENLPDGRGSDLLDIIRKRPHSETTPVIVLTGHLDPELEVAGLEAGATDYLFKPVDGEALLARVGTRLRDHASWLTMVRSAAQRGETDHLRFESGQRQVLDVIRHQSFRPVFQPIVGLGDGGVIGFEALTRFDDGTPPDLLFTRATSTELGIDLEMTCLEAALAASSSLPPGTFVSLNVSPGLLARPGTDLGRLVELADRPVVLELTEREAIDDYDAVRSALARLPSVVLSIDDAGAGFSSLRHVVQLEPEYVKLDRSWVGGIDDQPMLQAMVAGLVHFASTAGCQLIAEGIETVAERDALIELGVALGQGFLLGRPAPPLSAA